MPSSSRLNGVLRKILPILVVSLMLISSPALVVAQTTSYPASTAITFISYNGNDAGGVLGFLHGQIAFYSYGLPPTMYTYLPPGAKPYYVPATLYDVLVNPLNTTFGFNPFQFQQVRFALNFILNRTYFVDTILHGYGIKSITIYTGEPDELHMLSTLAQYSYIHYNFTYANETIYKVLTAHGAQYINGKWYYNGKPITVYVFVRVDTTVRKAYAEYLISQLEKLGFTVQEIPGNLQKEISLIYGSDPATAGWDIAIEAWGGVYSYYDAGLAIGLYSTLGASAPFTSYYGLSMGSFNDSQYEHPSLLKEANEIDNLSLIIVQSLFTSRQEYYQLESEITELGIQMAVRLGLGMSVLPIYVAGGVTGVYPSYAQDTLLSFQTYLAIRNGTYPNVTIGVRWLSQGAANPGVGFTDAYTDEIGTALFAPAYLSVPGTGYDIPYIFTYKIINSSPHAIIPVPTNALWWNPAKQEITYVPPNTTAQVAAIFNLAPLFNNDKWADGQNITLADIIYQYVIACEMSLNSSNPIYDSVASTVYGPPLSLIKGFKIINSTAIEIWGNTWFFDPNEEAISLFTSFNPLGYALVGGGYFPWQMYVGMKDVVAEGKAAWSSATAESKGIDWLNLLSPTDVSYILSALENASAHDYIPKSLLEVENLSGITLVTPQQAEAGYQAAINFIKTYGNAMIGDGPFILVAWQPSVSPPYAKIVKNPYFHLAPPAQAMVEPATYTVSFVPPATVFPGETLNGSITQMVAGSTTATPAAGINVYIVITAPNGTILYTNQTTTNSNGVFTFTVPSTLLPGAYNVQIYAYSNISILLNPVTASLVVVPAITTTTTTTTTTPTTSTTTTSTTTSTTTTTTTTTPTTTTSTTTTTTTSVPVTTTPTSTTTISGISTTTIGIIVAIVLIVIVIGVVFGVVRRR